MNGVQGSEPVTLRRHATKDGRTKEGFGMIAGSGVVQSHPSTIRFHLKLGRKAEFQGELVWQSAEKIGPKEEQNGVVRLLDSSSE